VGNWIAEVVGAVLDDDNSRSIKPIVLHELESVEEEYED
jgi:hypothetical protein